MRSSGGSGGRKEELMQQSRLRWQCRRGMRELDVLLSNYLERQYPGSDESHKTAFCHLLELPDPELMGYLLSGENPAEPDLAHVVDCIRGSASS
jgi:antitoxin CptB